MFTAISSATVPAAVGKLPQLNALKLNDRPFQIIADSLMPRELNALMQVAHYDHRQLSKLRKNGRLKLSLGCTGQNR